MSALTIRRWTDAGRAERAEGYAAERAGLPWKRWQTAEWRDGWAEGRRDRRLSEEDAHEDTLNAPDGCQDPACPFPYCVQSRARIAAINAEAA